MNIPMINNLQRETWSSNPVFINLNALQELENGLAAQENRTPSVVRAMQDDGNTNGKFVPEHMDERGDQHDNTIFVNVKHLTDDNPYKATETLFHEARHAYQQHLVQNPDQATDLAQVEDWRINNSLEGYLDPEKWGYDPYRWQPGEADSNSIARERTDQLYEQQLADPEYTNYRLSRESQLAVEKERARNHYLLGENFEEKARDLSYYQYNQIMSQGQESQAVAAHDEIKTHSPATQPQERAISESADQLPGKEVSQPGEDESQAEDYHLGYGH